MLQIDDLVLPFIIADTLSWISSDEPEPWEQTMKMIAFALLIPLLHCMVHTTWEYFCFQMIEVGHRAHTSLKVMLFRKNIRMTTATNKDFSTGEISHIIMGESNCIWQFIWDAPNFLECPLHLINGTYIVFRELGWSGMVVFVFVVCQITYGNFRGRFEKDINKEKSEKSTKRMLHINESFTNIKSVKLFGWENKFLDLIENMFQEELAIDDRKLMRRKMLDIVSGLFNQLMIFAVYGTYTALGNTLTLS